MAHCEYCKQEIRLGPVVHRCAGRDAAAKEQPKARRSAAACSSVNGDFYQGVEWLACWLLDHAEGETITEEQLRPWAQKAWFAHLDRKNTLL